MIYPANRPKLEFSCKVLKSDKVGNQNLSTLKRSVKNHKCFESKIPNSLSQGNFFLKYSSTDS